MYYVIKYDVYICLKRGCSYYNNQYTKNKTWLYPN
jgi:hypothetical protein